MLKFRNIEKLKYIYCSSCGKDNIDLVSIRAFVKTDSNYNAMALCADCLGELHKLLEEHYDS